MDKRLKWLAGLCACIMFFAFLPKTTLVVGPKRSVAIVSTDRLEQEQRQQESLAQADAAPKTDRLSVAGEPAAEETAPADVASSAENPSEPQALLQAPSETPASAAPQVVSPSTPPAAATAPSPAASAPSAAAAPVAAVQPPAAVAGAADTAAADAGAEETAPARGLDFGASGLAQANVAPTTAAKPHTVAKAGASAEPSAVAAAAPAPAPAPVAPAAAAAAMPAPSSPAAAVAAAAPAPVAEPDATAPPAKPASWEPVVTVEAPAPATAVPAATAVPIAPAPAPAPAPSSPVAAVAAAPTPVASTAAPAGDVIARSPAKPETSWSERGDKGTEINRQIAPILAAHPDRDLVLCLAGCGGGISIVQIRRRPQLVAATTGEMVPTASGKTRPGSGDVICVAGCVGAPGRVVFSNTRLSWISDEGSEAVKAALRAVAERVIAREGLTPVEFERRWVSASARAHLVIDAPPPAIPFVFAGIKVATLVARRETAIAMSE